MLKEKSAADEAQTIEADEMIDTDSTLKPHFFRPAVICGICEACGSVKNEGGSVTKVKDHQTGQEGFRVKGGSWINLDATQCPHYKSLYDAGKGIACSGCGEKFTGAKNSLGKFSEKLGSRQVLAFSFVDNPTKVLFYCDDWACANKRFNRLKS